MGFDALLFGFRVVHHHQQQQQQQQRRRQQEQQNHQQAAGVGDALSVAYYSTLQPQLTK